MKEYTVIGRPLETMVFGGVLFVNTEKGLFWWDEPCWRKLGAEPLQTPAEPLHLMMAADG